MISRQTLLSQVSSSFVLSGKYLVKAPITNNMTTKMAALNFQGNQYKKIAEKNFGPFCDVLYQEGVKSNFESFVSRTTTKIPWKTCPFPAGSDEVNNWMMSDLSDMLPPYIPGGEKWKLEVRFLEGEIELGGYNLYALVRNDESLLKGG
jgi:hypothetical protein